VPGIPGGGVEEAVIAEWVHSGFLLFWIPAFAGMTVFRLLCQAFGLPRNDEIALMTVLWLIPKILPILV